MCEPITSFVAANAGAISVGLTAAGTAAQIAGQKQAQRAMNNAYAVESGRQKGLQGEQQKIFDDSLAGQGSDTQKSNIAAAEKARTDAAVAAQTQKPVVNIAPAGGTSRVVAEDTSAAISDANARSRREGAAKALLSGFGDVQLGNALANTHARQNVGMLSDFSRGSSTVNQYEMDVASHKGDKTKKIGDILTAAGFVTGMAGASGWGKVPAGTPAAADVGVVWSPPDLSNPATRLYG